MIYELRSHHAAPGQIERPHRRFAEHTLFALDPDWKKAKAESEDEGRLVGAITSQVSTATPCSPPV